MKKNKSSPPPAHRDKLGRHLVADQFIAYPDHKTLEFGKVVKLTPKMISIVRVSKSNFKKSTINKYPSDVVIVEDSAMTWFY